jgi:hypothetical protein
MNQKEKEELFSLSLKEVSDLFGDGVFSLEEVQQYVDVWNNTSGRFTTAKIGMNYIYQVNK